MQEIGTMLRLRWLVVSLIFLRVNRESMSELLDGLQLYRWL